MADQIKPPVGGGNPKAPKRVHGRGWLLKRARNGLSWQQRKARSQRYCAPIQRASATT
jgi:hypothetical protein